MLSESLEVIGEERERALFGKLFCRIVSSRVIVEDEGGIIANGRQIGLDVVSIFAFLVMIIITIAAASSIPPHLFAGPDANLDQSAVWDQTREGCDWRLISHPRD
ncbi:hypothetical protein PENNAL_c0111G01388 [Penicillium nalgiovense]|uniref:Uncharacterized protein n=1 Tax=Penicillium nalgiovense TaxID=60175 RepID=A0A1V6X7J8_PENNA|nr:hypothetical protein PENNAL_c0111G01388 [Penicillium nalgiovense]